MGRKPGWVSHLGDVALLLLILAAAWAIWWLVPVRPRVTLSAVHDQVFAGFSADGSVVATMTDRQWKSDESGDGSRRQIVGGPVRIWDTRTGKERLRLADDLEQLGGYYPSVEFSPDGRLLVTGGRDITLRLWDAQTGTVRATCEKVDFLWSRAFKFSPDSQTLAIVSASEIKLFDTNTGQSRVRLDAADVAGLTFSPDSSLLAIAQQKGGEDELDSILRIWEVKTGQERLRFRPEGRIVSRTTLAFSPDGALLAFDTTEGISLFALPTGASRGTLLMPEHRRGRLIKSLRFVPEGNLLLALLYGGECIMWDLRTRLPRDVVSNDDLLFSANGGLMAWSRQEGATRQVTVWDVSAMKEICTFSPNWPLGEMRVLGFAPDSRTLAVGGAWQTKDEDDPARAVRYLVHGNVMKESCGEVKLFDALTGEERGTLEIDSRRAEIVFCPDGQTFAETDGKIRLYDLPLHRAWGTLLALWAIAALPLVGRVAWHIFRKRQVAARSL